MSMRRLIASTSVGFGLSLLVLASNGSADSKSMGKVTFSKDVAPIFYANCAVCHRPNDLAPMSLLTYKDSRPWAKSIKEKVLTREMPPWHADPQHDQFSNDRRLTQKEIDTIIAWVDQGAHEGNPMDLPPTPVFAEGWHIGEPDVVLSMQNEHTVEAEGPDDYLYFMIPTSFKEDKWVQAAEIRPGNRKVVHHVIAFVAPADVAWQAATRRRNAAQAGSSFFYTEGTLRRVKMDAPVSDDGCNVPPDLAAAVSRNRGSNRTEGFLTGFAPGKDWDIFPQGVAKKVPAGSIIVFQMHYSKQGSVEKDRTSIGLVFAKEPPEKIAVTTGISNILFKIPPGADGHQVTSCMTLDRDIEIFSYMPHMHVRGKDMKYEAIYPDGRRELLLSVPSYSFAWQEVYKLKTPKVLPKGTKLVVTAHFDNSTRNRYNPDATKTVRWGDPTYDEMMIGWIDYLVPNPAADVARSGDR